MIIAIFANGQLSEKDYLDPLIEQADCIIAADGGANHCNNLNIVPNVVIGDLDSIDPQTLKSIEDKGIPLHRYPERKNATDLELCLDFAIAQGAAKIHIFAALGGRWDMSLANIQLCASKKHKNTEITLYGEGCVINILHPGAVHTIPGPVGKRVSLLSLEQDAVGVTLTGFEYPLKNSTISFGSSRGVSNILKTEPATISLNHGTLLCIQSPGKTRPRL